MIKKEKLIRYFRIGGPKLTFSVKWSRKKKFKGEKNKWQISRILAFPFTLAPLKPSVKEAIIEKATKVPLFSCKTFNQKVSVSYFENYFYFNMHTHYRHAIFSINSILMNE